MVKFDFEDDNAFAVSGGSLRRYSVTIFSVLIPRDHASNIANVESLMSAEVAHGHSVLRTRGNQCFVRRNKGLIVEHSRHDEHFQFESDS